MRILITNDDGITADGLGVAEQIAQEIAGSDGEVWVVAPESDQSGIAHALTYTSIVKMTQLSERRFVVTGTPADCIILGTEVVLESAPPDLILSGVNRGHNIADDPIVSGTVGGAVEGVMRGFTSIALSQAYGPGLDPDAPWSSAAAYGVEVVRRLLELEVPSRVAFNVNFPARPATETLGIRWVKLGQRETGPMKPIPCETPRTRGEYFWLSYHPAKPISDQDTDQQLCAEGWITVTPLNADMTAHTLLNPEFAAQIDWDKQ